MKHLFKTIILLAVFIGCAKANAQERFDKNGLPIKQSNTYYNNRFKRTSFEQGKLILKKDIEINKIGLYNNTADKWEIPAKYESYGFITEGPYLILEFDNGQDDRYTDIYLREKGSYKLLQTEVRKQSDIKPELYFQGLINVTQDSVDTKIYYIETNEGKGVLSLNLLDFHRNNTCIDTLLSPKFDNIIGLTNNIYSNDGLSSELNKYEDRINVFYGILDNEITCSFISPNYEYNYPNLQFESSNLALEKFTFPQATGIGVSYQIDPDGNIYLHLNYTVNDKISGYHLTNQAIVNSDTVSFRKKQLIELEPDQGLGYYYHNYKGIDLGVPGYIVVNHKSIDYLGREVDYIPYMNNDGYDSIDVNGDYVYPEAEYFHGVYQSGVLNRSTITGLLSLNM